MQTYNDDFFKISTTVIPDGSVSMIFADIPYNMTDCDFDKNVWNLEEMWAIFHRVLKPNGVVVMTATEPFNVDLINSNRKEFRYSWVWKKNQATGNLNANKMPLRNYELILIFYKKLPVYNPIKTYGHKLLRKNSAIDKGSVYKSGVKKRTPYASTERYPLAIQEFKTVSRNGSLGRLRHPTEKPLELLEYMIKTYTNEGDLVLDPCMGTGVTMLACKNLNRTGIGFELDKAYYDTALQRLAIHG